MDKVSLFVIENLCLVLINAIGSFELLDNLGRAKWKQFHVDDPEQELHLNIL